MASSTAYAGEDGRIMASFDAIFIMRFSSKSGVNSIDLDRNVLVFVQKWGEKYRFGRKSASEIPASVLPQ